mmetsp:Transcript_34451/g.76561  ORF Transcript_34451/g.76561 Transcript_34451/m.76561 type:complete len:218 (+) Transcript_34451:423-1076(+)
MLQQLLNDTLEARLCPPHPHMETEAVKQAGCRIPHPPPALDGSSIRKRITPDHVAFLVRPGPGYRAVLHPLPRHQPAARQHPHQVLEGALHGAAVLIHSDHDVGGGSVHLLGEAHMRGSCTCLSEGGHQGCTDGGQRHDNRTGSTGGGKDQAPGSRSSTWARRAGRGPAAWRLPRPWSGSSSSSSSGCHCPLSCSCCSLGLPSCRNRLLPSWEGDRC